MDLLILIVIIRARRVYSVTVFKLCLYELQEAETQMEITSRLTLGQRPEMYNVQPAIEI